MLNGLKQSVDLTEMAKNGKLDPTIGRDEGVLFVTITIRLYVDFAMSEIRRTIQSTWTFGTVNA